MAASVRIYRIPGLPTTALPKLRTYGLADEFDRANAATLGTSEDGKTWLPLRGVWGIAGGAAQVSEIGAGGVQIAVAETYTPNGILRAVFGEIGADASAGLIFRALDTNNHLLINAAAGGKLRLWKRVAGAATAIADGTSAIGPIAPGDIITVEGHGTTVYVKKNGTTAIAIAVPEFAGATKHGMAVNALTTRVERISFTPDA